ncbi:MAG: NAD-dependent epimerase/dehydratase family protein [Thermocrispum sp.]
MKVFVTGGTGAIGRHVVPRLIADGHTVTALARGPQKAAELERHGARPAQVSLFDADALAAAFAGHDAVANLATAIPSTASYPFRRAWMANDRIRTEGSAAVLRAARAAGVGRLVQESVAFVYPDRGDAWIDESTEPDVFPILEGNLAAEANAGRFAADGGDGVVLRFGLFYGPGSAHTDEMLAMARRRFGVQLGPPSAYQPTIHLEDAAAAVSAALSVPSGTYNVSDDEPLTAREFTDAIAAAVGRRPLLRGPGRLAVLGGRNMAAITRSQRVSNRRFRTAASWSPRYPDARAGWTATVAAG